MRTTILLHQLGGNSGGKRFCPPLLQNVLLTSAWFALATTLLAIDPLPPELEKASPEAQRVYRERLARESMEEKIAVGKKRYDERMRYQHKLIEGARREAELREKAIFSQIDSQSAPVESSVPAPQAFFGKLPLLCILGVFGYLVSSRVIKGLWYGATPSLVRRR